jgi:hypothetical protein
MLREDDLFKVVLNPGADKREKRILGQITPLGQDKLFSSLCPGDTGGVVLSAIGLRIGIPDGCISATQLL